MLLYCWHSYSARIGTGLWYASMNYCVHAVMYLYFGLTQCGPRGRRFAKRFARFITTIQLAQMVGGITVTIASVVFHGRGDTCYVSLANSALGLMMYTSYFVLFAQLSGKVHRQRRPAAAVCFGRARAVAPVSGPRHVRRRGSRRPAQACPAVRV